jgi:uncharacterized protein DUF6152
MINLRRGGYLNYYKFISPRRLECRRHQDKAMTAKLIRLSTVALALLISAVPAFAHHGTAAYQEDKQITVTGTVTEFSFANPHTLVYLDVKQSDGTIAKWQGEMTSPNHLVRAGWTKNTLEPGEVITISGLPAKKGMSSLWIRKIVKANGTELPLVME